MKKLVLLLALLCGACDSDSGQSSAPTFTTTPTPTTTPTLTPTPAPSNTIAYTKAADARIARITSANGTAFTISGEKNSAGIATSVTSVETTTPDGPVRFTYDLQKRLTGITINGAKVSFYYDSTGAEAEFTTPEGASISTFVASATSSSAVRSQGASANVASASRLATASYRSCGFPSRGDLYFDIFDSNTGIVSQSIPGRSTGQGSYEATIPTVDTNLDIDIKPREIAQSIADVVISVCNSGANLELLSQSCDFL